MELSEIQAAKSKERQKSDLQHLADGFYEDAGEFVRSLREEREELSDSVDDPFSNTDIQELTDAISVARESITAIHERRMGKIVKRASLAAAGMPANEDGLTAEEKDLFDNLVDQLENSREDILANLDAAPPAQPDVGDKEEDQADPTPSPEDSSESSSSDESDGQEPESVGDEAVDDGVPRQCVQVLTDVGEIFGVDEREYDLQEDDVVTLPEANAEALVGKDAAMILD